MRARCKLGPTIGQVSYVLGAKYVPGLPVVPPRGPLVLQLSNERRLDQFAILLCRGAALAPHPDLALKHLPTIQRSSLELLIEIDRWFDAPKCPDQVPGLHMGPGDFMAERRFLKEICSTLWSLYDKCSAQEEQPYHLVSAECI